MPHLCRPSECRCPEYDPDHECGGCESYTDGRTCENCGAVRCEACRKWVPASEMAEGDDEFCQPCYDEPLAEVD